jgi:hypothetical protein
LYPSVKSLYCYSDHIDGREGSNKKKNLVAQVDLFDIEFPILPRSIRYESHHHGPRPTTVERYLTDPNDLLWVRETIDGGMVGSSLSPGESLVPAQILFQLLANAERVQDMGLTPHLSPRTSFPAKGNLRKTRTI